MKEMLDEICKSLGVNNQIISNYEINKFFWILSFVYFCSGCQIANKKRSSDRVNMIPTEIRGLWHKIDTNFFRFGENKLTIYMRCKDGLSFSSGSASVSFSDAALSIHSPLVVKTLDPGNCPTLELPSGESSYQIKSGRLILTGSSGIILDRASQSQISQLQRFLDNAEPQNSSPIGGNTDGSSQFNRVSPISTILGTTPMTQLGERNDIRLRILRDIYVKPNGFTIRALTLFQGELLDIHDHHKTEEYCVIGADFQLIENAGTTYKIIKFLKFDDVPPSANSLGGTSFRFHVENNTNKNLESIECIYRDGRDSATIQYSSWQNLLGDYFELVPHQ